MLVLGRGVFWWVRVEREKGVGGSRNDGKNGKDSNVEPLLLFGPVHGVLRVMGSVPVDDVGVLLGLLRHSLLLISRDSIAAG